MKGKKSTYSSDVVIHFIFQCTRHQPISVADVGLRVNHVKLIFYIIVSTICVF
jgi:hypothetical protein